MWSTWTIRCPRSPNCERGMRSSNLHELHFTWRDYTTAVPESLIGLTCVGSRLSKPHAVKVAARRPRANGIRDAVQRKAAKPRRREHYPSPPP